jgi:hypothetical protein
MIWFRLMVIATAGLASTASVLAQDVQITVDSAPSAAEIHAWLSSGDSRLIAWGAYFAAQNGGSDTSGQLLHLLESWNGSGAAKHVPGEIGAGAMTEVLDALILLQSEVTPIQSASIAEYFPVQAAIFASRLPIVEARPLELSWYGDGAGNNGPRLDRVAAMMLSKAPPPGFAADIVAKSKERLRVSVVDGGGAGGGYGGGCGCGLISGDSAGWPPIYVYRLEENRPGSTDPVLIEAGGDRVTYHRVVEPGGGGCAAGIGPLDDRARHNLLAEMVGFTKETMPWKEQESASIQWSGGESFLRDLQDLVAGEEAKLHETVETLFEKGLLTANEVNSLRPKLLVQVNDDRMNKDAALPRWDSIDPLTVITYDSLETSVSE